MLKIWWYITSLIRAGSTGLIEAELWFVYCSCMSSPSQRLYGILFSADSDFIKTLMRPESPATTKPDLTDDLPPACASWFPTTKGKTE